MPKRTRQASNNVIHLPATTNLATPPGRDLTHDAVALRAFELYCQRGREDGRDLDDWLEAERELRNEATSSAA
jgi:hypothetical protein